MDVFSLLKFWKNAGGGVIGGDSNSIPGDFDFTAKDDESFFDLVLTVPNDVAENHNGTSPTADAINGSHSDHHPTFSKFDGAESKSNFNCSSPDSVIFTNSYKRKIFSHDSSNSKPQSPFRVLMLGFNSSSKSKSGKTEMKCEIEEVTISSLLKRDNSLRSKLRSEKFLDNDQPSKRFSKDAVNKYLNLIKPLYVKVSKRNNEKLMSVTPSSSPAASSVLSPRKEEKQGGTRRTVFRDVRKHLGKSRSASSAIVKAVQIPAGKSDDSVLLQQDGIQSAILHCKRSYNSPSQGCSVLSRSGSAPSNNQPRISVDEVKRSSI